MNSSFSENTKMRKVTIIVERQLEHQLLLIHPTTEAVFHLNELGKALWHMLDSPMEQIELLKIFQTAFPDIEAQKLQRDILALLRQLYENGLIEICV